MPKRDIYIAIMRAAERGAGLHLTADEIFDLSMDDAISTRAGNGLSEEEAVALFADANTNWGKINPYKRRKAANWCVGED